MEKTAHLIVEPSLSRRRLLIAGGALLFSPALAVAGAQREETLSDDVALVMRGSINNVNPARLVFANAAEGERWLQTMSSRLARFVPECCRAPPFAHQYSLRSQPRRIGSAGSIGLD